MAKNPFAATRERLSNDKISSMSAAELKAEAHQRGWTFGDMGARSARTLFWNLQNHYMGAEAQETTVENATTAAERHKAHMAEKGIEVEDTAAQGVVSAEVTSKEQEALEAMRENERKNSTPGIQPGRDDRTAEQKAAIDSNLESKREQGLTGEPDQTVNTETHRGSTIETVEEGSEATDEEVDEAHQNNEGDDAEDEDED